MKKKIPLIAVIYLIAFNAFSQIQSGSIYKIVSKASNKVLDVNNSSIANGANVATWTDTKSDAQRWIVNSVGNNQYTLTNVGSGKMLHIANATPANSVNIDQRDNTNDNTVKWAIVSQGNGYFTVQTAANPGFVMDLFAGATADGANVALWGASSGSNNQAWAFQLQTARAVAPSAAAADEIFAAWKAKYYDTRTGNQVILNEGFWGVAEMMEMVVDAYEVTGNAKYKTLFDEMYRLFIAKEGQDWMWNDFNDDITWMVLACVRAGVLTNNPVYINKGKEQFDKMYARAVRDNGNWLVWKQGISGTNSCINGPAMVACSYLAQVTGDNSYYSKATSLYNWSKVHLFEPNTGKVYDNNDNGKINYWSSTYNQGTYLGASVMLYNHTKDPSYLAIADKIAQYTKVNMYNSGVINNEEGPDLNGFKGIFMRYARRYVIDCNRADYIPWLQLNAKVAYNNRNTENIISTIWSNRAKEATAYAAFNAHTAVSLLINCPYSTSATTKSAYNTIEAESFNSSKGVVVEPCPEGTSNLGGVQNDYYTAYNNVDFGTYGAATAQFRLSCATQGGTIEVRLGSLTGTLIGTATVASTGAWNTYTTVTCPVSNVKGLQNIYLLYKGASYVCNLNSFKFTQAQPINAAVVYKDCNYTGTAVNLKAGRYTLANMAASGILNDDVSSLKVLAGYKIVAYWDDNFQGASTTFTGNDDCLVDNGWNDKISSMEVLATGAARKGAASELSVKEISVFPNPAADVVTLTNIPANTLIAVSDLVGRTVLRVKSPGINGDVRVDVSRLKAGTYSIKIGNEEGRMLAIVK